MGDELDGNDSKMAECGKSSSGHSMLSTELIHNRSPEKLYCDVMQPLQFGILLPVVNHLQTSLIFINCF